MCCALAAMAACRGAERPASEPPPALSLSNGLVAQVAGTIEIDGLAGPVRVTRDRWGVAHISARSRDDLFTAQGFVQAQDRLFQMDLWRRAAQGRLAEVLGPSFIERDAMTRRVQYRGDRDDEWSSYGPDTEAIAAAFVRGVNSYVTLARARLPEMFVLAGWTPDLWSPDDLLNRTDAFESSGGAIEDVARRFGDIVADAIRRVGAPPFFAGLNASIRAPRFRLKAPQVRLKADTPYDDLELVAPGAYAPFAPSFVDHADGALHVAESTRRYQTPSARYLVHLQAPGWNVAGATAPWRPGVAIGHNDRLTWGSAAVDRPAWSVSAQPIGPGSSRIVRDSIAVKGRAEPFAYETELTRHGVVVATDRAHGVNYVLDWSGFEIGAAPELAALAIDGANNATEFRAAAARWKMPARRLVMLAGREGREGLERRAGLERREERAATHRALFAHLFGISRALRERFNVGPLARPERDQPFRAVFVPRSWDGSRIMNAPGQSESPDSPHFSDLAALWSAGETIPLAFSDAAVTTNAAATLTLVPPRK